MEESVFEADVGKGQDGYLLVHAGRAVREVRKRERNFGMS